MKKQLIRFLIDASDVIFAGLIFAVLAGELFFILFTIIKLISTP